MGKVYWEFLAYFLQKDCFELVYTDTGILRNAMLGYIKMFFWGTYTKKCYVRLQKIDMLGSKHVILGTEMACLVCNLSQHGMLGSINAMIGS